MDETATAPTGTQSHEGRDQDEDMRELHLRAGSRGIVPTPPYELRLTPEDAGWDYSGLAVVTLAPREYHELNTEASELVVLSLGGGCTVQVTDADGAHHEFVLQGRAGVFAGVSDMVYVPREARMRLHSPGGGSFALPSARCHRRLEPRYRPAEEVPVELRGAGNCSRQVHNFCSADSFPADRLIAVEVLTPAGNWSSYPPHKHDETTEHEIELEEIYYYQVSVPVDTRGAPMTTVTTSDPLAYQRVYGTTERPIDVLAEVRSGDVILIPHGWHGPSMATPGHHLYYLNVMAGPGPERAWRICDDPAHGWVRETWQQQALDPRLPLFDPEWEE